MRKRVSSFAVALTLSLHSLAFADDVPAGIKLQERGHGWILSNAQGMTLYTFTRDLVPGKSACLQQCAQQWPPMLASADAQVAQAKDDDADGSDWSLIRRSEGQLQWAYRGKPLYTSYRDRNPGDTFADGLANQWYVAMKPIPLPPAIRVGHTALGEALTDGGGLTLYMSDADPAGKSTCDARCGITWKAVRAPWTARPDPATNWSIIVSKDGTSQWAFKGKALYTYDHDIRPGDTYGHGVEGRKVAVLQPLPPNPAWVTYQVSDGGVLAPDSSVVVADENAATLYVLDETRRNGAKSGIQRPQDWKPVIAKPDAAPVGNWGITEANGVRQWTHKGFLVFTHVLDKRPGQLHGIRSTDAMWRTITRSGDVMEGAGP